MTLLATVRRQEKRSKRPHLVKIGQVRWSKLQTLAAQNIVLVDWP